MSKLVRLLPTAKGVARIAKVRERFLKEINQLHQGLEEISTVVDEKQERIEDLVVRREAIVRAIEEQIDEENEAIVVLNREAEEAVGLLQRLKSLVG